MNDRPMFQGDLVRLAAVNPETDVQAFWTWTLRSEFLRLLDSEPARPHSPQFVQQSLNQPEIFENGFLFTVRTLLDDQAIGRAELDGIEWPHASGWAGIGIGEPDYWDRGYGSDALRILLRFAFNEVGLYRISLNVFEYNQRAVHVYEKLGFKIEGHISGFLARDGKRWDLIYLGLLRPEWQEG